MTTTTRRKGNHIERRTTIEVRLIAQKSIEQWEQRGIVQQENWTLTMTQR